MKKVLTFLFCLSTFCLFGQKLKTLTGTVVDEKGERIVYAVIIVYKDGVPIAGETSDFEGEYRIRNIASGTYNIECSMLGYEKSGRHHVKVTSDIVKSDFILYEAPMLFEECVITGYKNNTVTHDCSSGCDLRFDHDELILNGHTEDGKNVLDIKIKERFTPDFYYLETSKDNKTWSFLAKFDPICGHRNPYADGGTHNDACSQMHYIDESAHSGDSVYYQLHGIKRSQNAEDDFEFHGFLIDVNHSAWAHTTLPTPKTPTFNIESVRTEAAGNLLKVNIKATKNLPVQFRLTDMLGRVWAEQSVNLITGEQTFEQSIDQLIAGIYCVSIIQGQRIQTVKFVKL
jgi:Carboxypeptidase regulatory-like domain